jgi:hypothetical protein
MDPRKKAKLAVGRRLMKARAKRCQVQTVDFLMNLGPDHGQTYLTRSHLTKLVKASADPANDLFVIEGSHPPRARRVDRMTERMSLLRDERGLLARKMGPYAGSTFMPGVVVSFVADRITKMPNPESPRHRVPSCACIADDLVAFDALIESGNTKERAMAERLAKLCDIGGATIEGVRLKRRRVSSPTRP